MFTHDEKTDHPRSYTFWLSVCDELVRAYPLLLEKQETLAIHHVIAAINAELQKTNPDAEQYPFLALTIPDTVALTLNELQQEKYGLSNALFPLSNTFFEAIPSWSSWSQMNSDSKLHLLNFMNNENNIMFASQTDYGLFKTAINLQKFILVVVHGQQSKAEEILKKYPHFLLERVNVADYSGRKFIKITAFEYALWSLDVKYMCPMMLDCLPNNAEGERMRLALLKQYDNLIKIGINFIFEKKNYQASFYDFKSLTDCLQIYVDQYTTCTQAQRENQYNEIGKAQCLVPVHVAQHYCDPDTPFNPTPAFNQDKRPQTLMFNNTITKKTELWFPRISDSMNFGISRSGRVNCEGAHRGWTTARVRVVADLAALTRLFELRISRDLVAVKAQLEQPVRDHCLNFR